MRFKILPILIISFLVFISNINARDYWGLRRIDANRNLSDAELGKYNAQFFHMSISWGRTETSDDVFNWDMIDAGLERTKKMGAKSILLITPGCQWASGGQEPKAPTDLDRQTPLNDPAPERGYTEYLYDFTYKLIDHVAKNFPELLSFLRYGNEPQYPDHWAQSASTYVQDVDDFIRCLRTVYIAAHKAAEDNGLEIKVSHGGFYYDDQLIKDWYDYGNANPRAQDSLISLFRSRYERHWHQTIETWVKFGQRVNRAVGIPPTYWMDAMAGQTDWLDWFDVHHHWKPRYIFDELGAFEKRVIDSGGILRPWFSAETSMQLGLDSDTDYEGRFHAGDMIRKWTIGMAFGLKGTCTPVVGFPPERFFGLYDPDGNEYLSAEAYRFLHSLIQPNEDPVDMSGDGFRAYRFNEDAGIIDVVWYDALFDADDSKHEYSLNPPDDYPYATIYDPIGEVVSKRVDKLLLSQEPRIIVWSKEQLPESIRAKYEPPNGYVYHGIGWNYKNSVPLYLEMMPDSLQPLLFQVMSAIPGTRPLDATKVEGGIVTKYMNPETQYSEYGVHFHKTQDEPKDSIFAFTTDMDHYMDTLAAGIKAANRPFFLRIGGEMNGAWNKYTPYTFPIAFRKLVEGLRARGVDNFASVWCYEPDAPKDFADSTSKGWKWYPGDDVVDWFGLDVFPKRHFDPNEPDSVRNGVTAKGKADRFLKFALDRGKPVYLNETTSHSENILPDAEDPDQTDGQRVWESWFVPFFQLIRENTHIKAFNYINLDWTQIAKWEHWGDCRLEINTYIKEHWIEEMGKPLYIHAGYDITSISTAEFGLIMPNGGEKWETGTIELITWNEGEAENIKIEYTTDNSGNRIIIEEIYSASAGNYFWEVPDTPSDECKVRITDMDNPGNTDESDDVFSIAVARNPVIELISPNGREEWMAGTTQPIEWTSSDIDEVKIEYSLNGGRAWIAVKDKTQAIQNQFDWLVPNTPTTRCLVKVSDATNRSILDESDEMFSILEGSSVGDDRYLEDSFNIYPNPASGLCSITYSLRNPAEVEVSIYNFIGLEVLKIIGGHFEAGDYNNTISTQNLPSGIYTISLKAGVSIINKQLVVIK